MRRLPLVLALLAASPTQAATLRTLTTLNASVVKLSDLFDGAGPLADRVLGPAPPPGQRIVVEAPQLAAIARQFGVDWQPASNADRAVLDRPGRMLARESITAPLLAALARVGAPADAVVDLPGFEAPLVPTEARPQVVVEQADYEGESGRFDATVLIAGDGMLPERMHLSGTLEALLHVLVPARRLPAGTLLRADDLMPVTLRASAVRGEPVRDAAQAKGMQLRHAVAAGQPLVLAELERQVLVTKGAHVAMELTMRNLAVVARGTALQDGGLGDRIDVLNPTSGLQLVGEIIGPDLVRVMPDSVPTPSSAALAQVAAQ